MFLVKSNIGNRMRGGSGEGVGGVNREMKKITDLRVERQG